MFGVKLIVRITKSDKRTVVITILFHLIWTAFMCTGIMVEHVGLRHLMMPIHVLTLTPTLVNIYGPVILTTVMCCV